MPTQPLYRFVLRQGLLELELACDDVALIQRQLAEVYQQHFMAWLGAPSLPPVATAPPQPKVPSPVVQEALQPPAKALPQEEIALPPPVAPVVASAPEPKPQHLAAVMEDEAVVIEVTLPPPSTPLPPEPSAPVTLSVPEPVEPEAENDDDSLEAALQALEADLSQETINETSPPAQLPVAEALPLPVVADVQAKTQRAEGLDALFDVPAVSPKAQPQMLPTPTVVQLKGDLAQSTLPIANEDVDDADDDILNALAHLDDNSLDEPYDDTDPMPQEVARENQLHTTFASFEAMIEACPPEAPRDHLLWAAYYLQQVEQSGAFTLQGLNGLLNEVGLPRAKHATLAALLDEALLEVKPDLTGTAEATDYSLTPQGVALMSQLLQQSVLA